jgi:hypothetical protein
VNGHVENCPADHNDDCQNLRNQDNEALVCGKTGAAGCARQLCTGAKLAAPILFRQTPDHPQQYERLATK